MKLEHQKIPTIYASLQERQLSQTHWASVAGVDFEFKQMVHASTNEFIQSHW